MKKFRFVAILLAVVMVLPFFGCNNRGNEEIDTTKTQIYIDHYNGGVGDSWFKPLKERFEAAYADYKIGDKVGVQLILSNHKNFGTELIDSVTSSNMDIFLSERFYYLEGIAKGDFLDITDVVTSMNSDGKTILSKLNQEQQDYYNYNGKYYALPHYAYYGGIVYNVDVFEDNLLYFSNNSSVNGGFITSLSATRSLGPDGKTGVIDGVDYSADDGLPATYEEFFKLCDRMIDCDVIPLTWSGEYGKAYFNYLLEHLFMTYEGKEQTMLNLTYNGTATHLVKSISQNGEVVFEEPTLITSENGYKIYTTAGRYYALKFAEQLFSKRDYYDYTNTSSGADSHTDAQTRYILSNYDSKQKPIAMLVEGTYWENEANGVGAFNTLKNLYKKDRSETRYAFMPMPKVDASHVGEKDVFTDGSYTLAFINSNVQTRCPEKIELLKEFLKFAYTDESLREYIAYTGSLKGVKYDLTDEDLSKVSYFTKTMIELTKKSEVVYPLFTNAKFSDNQSKLKIGATFSVNNYQFAMNAIKEGVTAKDYFEQITSYYDESFWKGI